MVTAVSMGYGHLRAAQALAEALGTEVARADRAPYAGWLERALWSVARRLYEGISRRSQGAILGPVLRPALDLLTRIGPPRGPGDPSRPTGAARFLDRLMAWNVARGVVEAARTGDRPLLTTYFVPALAAQRHSYRETYCLVTDTDVSRAWVPRASRETRITFLTPSPRATERLRSYGVPEERLVETGFPLPPDLLGGRDLPLLRRHLAARLARLDPPGAFRAAHRAEIETVLGPLEDSADRRAPLLTYAVGGAGAQAGLARRILADLAPAIRHGRLRLCLVAGCHAGLARRFTRWAEAAGLGSDLTSDPASNGGSGAVTVLAEPDLQSYFDRFHALLAETDVLWTKPSEMTFFAALGLPLLLASPVGAQERANRRWALDAGVALPRAAPEGTGRLLAWLLDRGALAAAAWTGFRRLPADGLYRILDLVGEAPAVGRSPLDVSRAPRRGRSFRAPSIPRACGS